MLSYIIQIVWTNTTCLIKYKLSDCLDKNFSEHRQFLNRHCWKSWPPNFTTSQWNTHSIISPRWKRSCFWKKAWTLHELVSAHFHFAYIFVVPTLSTLFVYVFLLQPDIVSAMNLFKIYNCINVQWIIKRAMFIRNFITFLLLASSFASATPSLIVALSCFLILSFLGLFWSFEYEAPTI